MNQRNQGDDDSQDHHALMGQASQPTTVKMSVMHMSVSNFPDRLQNQHCYEDSLDSDHEDHVSSNLD